MRVCKHGCGVKLFGFSRANRSRKHEFEKVFEFKTRQVYFIYPFVRQLKHDMENRYKEGESIFLRLS